MDIHGIRVSGAEGNLGGRGSFTHGPLRKKSKIKNIIGRQNEHTKEHEKLAI